MRDITCDDTGCFLEKGPAAPEQKNKEYNISEDTDSEIDRKATNNQIGGSGGGLAPTEDDVLIPLRISKRIIVKRKCKYPTKQVGKFRSKFRRKRASKEKTSKRRRKSTKIKPKKKQKSRSKRRKPVKRR